MQPIQRVLQVTRRSRFMSKLLASVCLTVAVWACAQENSAQDKHISQAIQQVSAARIQANIEKLVSFGTRSTLSAQDENSIKSGRGIGAAREWIKSEFERYSKDCGGCLEVQTDSFLEQPAERIPQPQPTSNPERLR